MTATIVRLCDCSDLQLDVVGCACGGDTRFRQSATERFAEQERIANAMLERALDREYRAELAYLEAEHEKDLARGFAWDPSWGRQPMDQHVRDHLTVLETAEPARLAA